jgi:hypothetical protein
MAKISRQWPEQWRDTERVSLVSSFVGTLFTGKYCPIDHGDGSGMNLLDLRARTWVPALLDFIGPDCAAKVPVRLSLSLSHYDIHAQQSCCQNHPQRLLSLRRRCLVDALLLPVNTAE